MAGLIRAARLAKEPLVLRPATPLAPAPVIKAMPAPEPVAHPPAQSFEDFQRQMGEELEQLRRGAREEGLRQGHEEGRRAGREQGVLEGHELAQAKVQAAMGAEVDAMRALLGSMRAELDRRIDGLEDLCAEIAFEAVAKVLGQSGAQPAAVTAMVREVVRRARDRSRLVVRVSPRDYGLIEAHRERILEGFDSGRVELVADDRVELGGCLLESPGGTLDGRLEVQMAALRDALLAAKARQAAEGGEA
jgi:flagellar assembly protein FliH